MKQDIRNPFELPDKLYPAEEVLAEGLAKGAGLKSSNGNLPKKRIRTGKDANVVRASVISFFVHGGSDEHPVIGPLIGLIGAYIIGDEPLDLLYAQAPYTLCFINCNFSVGINMTGMECRTLSMEGSLLQEGLLAQGLRAKGAVILRKVTSCKTVYLHGAHIEGDLDCDGDGGEFNKTDPKEAEHPGSDYALYADNLRVGGSVYLRNGFCAKGGIRMVGARIERDLDCDGGKLDNPNNCALLADGLSVGVAANFRKKFCAKGEVRMAGASIGHNMDCDGGQFDNPGQCALNAESMKVANSVFMRNGFVAKGTVYLPDSRIRGNLACTGGMFDEPGGYTIFASDMQVGGSVCLDKNNQIKKGFCSTGGVCIVSARIGGNLRCHGGIFNVSYKGLVSDGGQEEALVADGITVQGKVVLSGGFSANGVVRLVGATVEGNLECNGGTFKNPGGYAFVADKAVVKLDVFMDGKFSSAGETRLSGAHIGGNLDCSGGEFIGSEIALNFDSSTARGSVYLRDGFSAKGKVRMLGASIGNNLSCEKGRFINAGKDAIVADGLSVKGGVLLRKDFFVQGGVRLASARIGLVMECIDGQIGIGNSKGDNALNIDGAVIGDRLTWRNIRGAGIVDLSHAKVRALADDAGWGSFHVILDGFEYSRLVNANKLEDIISWLGKCPDSTPFSPQPYEQMAQVLFGMGYSDKARGVMLEKERLQTNSDEVSDWRRYCWQLWDCLAGNAARITEPAPWRKFGRQVWDALAGYGYSPGRIVGWMAVFVALGTAFFDVAARYDKIVPHQPAIMASSDYRAALEEWLSPMEAVRQAFPNEHPKFNAFAYSLDVFIPFFALHQEPFWAPHPGAGDGLWVPSIMLMVIVVSLLSGIIFWMRRKEAEAWIVLATLVPSLVVLILASWPWVLDWRWLTAWYWFEIAAGWVLTSLFLLSITGLLRPRQLAGGDG